MEEPVERQRAGSALLERMAVEGVVSGEGESRRNVGRSSLLAAMADVRCPNSGTVG